MPAQLTGPLRADRAPRIAHAGILVAGLIVFTLAASRLWLFFDDWAFVVDTPGAALAPHNGHWSTIPYAIFRAVRAVFGLDHYVAFAVPAILAHLVVIHLIWRATIRAGVRPWIATAVSFPLTFLGAGAENLAWAFQVGFVGAIAAMLGAILLLDRAPVGAFRIGGAIVLTVIALMSSGTALPLVAVAVAVSWVRRGFLRTLAIFAGPGVIYLAWYVLYARRDPDVGRVQGLVGALKVPEFAVTMLSDGFGRLFPLVVLGGLVFAAVAIWWMLSIRRAPAGALVAYVLFPAAPLFALLTGYSRAALGNATADSGRYVYLVVMVVAPVMTLALDRVTARLTVAAVVTLVVVIGLWNVGGVAAELSTREQRTAATRAHMSAAAQLVRSDPSLYTDDRRPYTLWSPDVTVGDLREWVARGWFRPAHYTSADTYGELATLDVSSAKGTPPGSRVGCDKLAVPVEPAARPGTPAVEVYAENATTVSVLVGDGRVDGEPRRLQVGAGWTRVALDRDRGLELGMTAPDLPVTVCPAR